MDDAERREARRLLAAMRFQERVMAIHDAGFDQLTDGGLALLDACWQIYAEDLGSRVEP